MQRIPFPRLRPAARAAAALVLLISLAEPSGAQIRSAWPTDPAEVSEARLLAGNSLLGGVTGGVAAMFRGDPVVDGFARGLAGGALVYVGKRIAAERADGAALVGRQVASVGSSMIGNTVAGRGALDRIGFGAGPVRLYAGRGVEGGLDWKLDVPAALVIAWAAFEPDATLDVERSLLSGMAVFRSERHEFAAPGTYFYSPISSAARREYVQAHEQIHVLQYDQALLSWSEPFEGWALGRTPVGRAVHRRLEFNLVGVALGLVGASRWDYDERPWEIEAMFMARQ